MQVLTIDDVHTRRERTGDPGGPTGPISPLGPSDPCMIHYIIIAAVLPRRYKKGYVATSVLILRRTYISSSWSRIASRTWLPLLSIVSRLSRITIISRSSLYGDKIKQAFM